MVQTGASSLASGGAPWGHAALGQPCQGGAAVAPPTAGIADCAAMPALPSLRLVLFYVAVFVVFGVLVPFWPLWLGARGLTAGELSLVLAVGQWAKAAANPLVGMAADHSGQPRLIMLMLSCATAASFLLCLWAHSFVALLLLSAAAAAFASALMPLGDNLALASAYSGKADYGRVRLWGSLTFVATLLIAGRILDGRSADTVLYLLIGGAALSFTACFGLPQGGAPIRRRFSPGWRALITPRLLVFLGAATLVQGSHSVLYIFGTLHWRAIGISDATIAVFWAEGTLAEVVLFFWGAALLRRIGPLGLIALGGGAGLVRWTVTAFATTVPLIALAQLLHAFSFGATHLGAMHHLARTVPDEQAATGQALYSAVVGSIGPGLIMLPMGPLYAAAGGLAYLAMAAIAIAGAALALRLSATKF
jgi:MFS transporter, PPP family, 3-phenylpropionic acid transporter